MYVVIITNRASNTVQVTEFESEAAAKEAMLLIAGMDPETRCAIVADGDDRVEEQQEEEAAA
jgi:hypothetical protein